MEKAPKPVDATVKILLMSQNMIASVNISPPQYGGKPLDAPMLSKALKERGVVFGIDAERVTSLGENPTYSKDIIIARGKPPVNGIDASLRFLVDIETSVRPTEREDGSVDFKQLGLIKNVTEGQVLCEKTPPTKGEPGNNVLGTLISAKAGRDVPLPKGKNTVVSDDGLALLAAKTGQLEKSGRALSISEVYNVSGDVSNATGNLTFTGSIIISGNVLTGFEVRAEGGITVNGTCEAALLKAGGDIIVKEGVNGGTLEAGGEIHSKYIQSSKVTAGGSIYTEAMLNSHTQCGETVNLIGSKGVLVGGSCAALTSIQATVIGNKNSALPTIVEVGTDPTMLARKNFLDSEIARLLKSMGDLGRIAELFEQLKAAGRLDEEKAERYISVSQTMKQEDERYAEYIAEREELTEKLEKVGHGFIVGTDCICPGVKIIIGPLIMDVKTPLPATRVTRGEEELLVQPAF